MFLVFTVKLAKDHAKNVESYERKRQTQMKERQEAFQEAFNEDVDYFREHGRLDRKYRYKYITFQEAFNEDVDYFREHGRLDRKYRWRPIYTTFNI